MTDRERAESAAMQLSADPFMRGLFADVIEHLLSAVRAETIEECAKVADDEEWFNEAARQAHGVFTAACIALKIRALASTERK